MEINQRKLWNWQAFMLIILMVLIACFEKKVELPDNRPPSEQAVFQKPSLPHDLTPPNFSGCQQTVKLSSHSKPIGIAANRFGDMFVIGYQDSQVYRYDTQANDIASDAALKDTVKYSQGNAYMYSDFTGFTTGFSPQAKASGVDCFENKPLSYLSATVEKIDPNNRIRVLYYCSDNGSDEKVFIPLISGKVLQDCLGKRCLHLSVTFDPYFESSTDKPEGAACDTKLKGIKLHYEHKS